MKKLAAVFTIVKDETVFLPIWVKYYSKYFPMEDIYVLDHQSIDGSTLNLPCNVQTVKNNEAFDSSWITDTVKAFQVKLLEEYEYVVFAEGDEILISLEDPGYDLYDHIKMMKEVGRNFDVATGYELMQNVLTESTYDSTHPVLTQRRHYYPNNLYNKTLITNIALDWTPGFHECQFKASPNKALHLLHLHRFDFQHYMQRKIRNTSYNLAKPRKPGDNFQQHFKEMKEMREYYFKQEDKLTKLPGNYPIVL
jgi:hypothetical protein